MEEQQKRIIPQEELEELKEMEIALERAGELADLINETPICMVDVDWLKETKKFDIEVIERILSKIDSVAVMDDVIQLITNCWNYYYKVGYDLCFFPPEISNGKKIPLFPNGDIKTILDATKDGILEDREAWYQMVAMKKAIREKYENFSPSTGETEEQEIAEVSLKGFTKVQLGILLYYVAEVIEGNTPVKKKIAQLTATVGGFNLKSVDQKLRGSFNESDLNYVADLVENVMPTLANKIRQTP